MVVHQEHTDALSPVSCFFHSLLITGRIRRGSGVNSKSLLYRPQGPFRSSCQPQSLMPDTSLSLIPYLHHFWEYCLSRPHRLSPSDAPHHHQVSTQFEYYSVEHAWLHCTPLHERCDRGWSLSRDQKKKSARQNL